VVGQAKKFSREIAERVKRGNRATLRRAKKQLDEMVRVLSAKVRNLSRSAYFCSWPAGLTLRNSLSHL